MNVGVILAAGKSSRFESPIPKQLYPLNGKPIIQHSIDLLSKYLDDLIIVTNSECAKSIKGKVVVNDTDDRLESIRVGLNEIDGCDNLLIHDAARPYITDDMICQLLESSKNNSHSQFFLPILDGLARKNHFSYEIPNRDEFIQLCSPQITRFDVFKSIFENYILSGIECEVLPIVDRLGFDFDLIKGNYRYLRKVTTLEDIF